MNRIQKEIANKLHGMKPQAIRNHLCGMKVPVPNYAPKGQEPKPWQFGVISGAWMYDGSIRVLIAYPNDENPRELFNVTLDEITEE